MAKEHTGAEPVSAFYFDFSLNCDILYKLLMPRLNVELATEFRQMGSANGCELWRREMRKLDPPRSDVAFHMKAKIQDVSKTICKDFAISVPFINFCECRLKELFV